MATRTRQAPSNSSSSSAATTWSERASQVGWVLLPLRLFLGVTMVYAAWLKLSDRSYLDPHAVNGVANQMRLAEAHSPISGIVSITAQHAVIFGLLIAVGELAVGLGVLLGIWTRLAALGGLLLALSFFLTVSWSTRPYFFGPDIVFVFAFTPLLIGGDGGVLSMWAAIRRRSRQVEGLPPVPTGGREPAAVAAAADRRALMQTGAAAVGIGFLSIFAASVARLFSSSPQPVAGGATTGTGNGAGTGAGTGTTPGTSSTGTKHPKNGQNQGQNQGTQQPTQQPTQSSSKPAGGVLLGSASAIAVGSSAQFTDPRNGQPGILLQPKAGTYLAYSAVCTHEGCTVGYSGSQIVCPCHGATYSAQTGDVTGGPAPSPLARINVVESDGKLYVV